jgi:hypothetical protein
MAKQKVYRITFINQDTTYQIFAREVGESDMFGFLEVAEFVFGEQTQLVVDPSEERLKQEFSGVRRTYIPMHAVIRIDEVDKEGVAKIMDKADGNVSKFPQLMVNNRRDENQ